MTGFECLKCGMCCDFEEQGKHDFSVYEFDHVFQLREQFRLDIRPFCGWVFGIKAIVVNWEWFQDGKCTFHKSNICTINARKPILCTMYPYVNNIWSRGTWRCLREEKEHLHPTRKGWYSDPLRSKMPRAMAYAAKIADKFLNGNDTFDIDRGTCIEDGSWRWVDNISKVAGVTELKPFYAEMTRLKEIPALFLGVMKSGMTMEEKFNALLPIPHTVINSRYRNHEMHTTVMDVAFQKWGESPCINWVEAL